MNSVMIQAETFWYAIYTKYKCEKQVARDLTSKGLQSYVPILEKVKRYTRKIKKHQIPLLNCYVFVKIDKSEQSKVLETENVIKFIKPGKTLTNIPEEEINILKRLVGDLDVEVNSEPLTLEIGEMVEIIKGSLIGLKGRLVKRENKNMVVVDLTSIGYQLNITVDIEAIKKL